jgi:hypothetical protein
VASRTRGDPSRHAPPGPAGPRGGPATGLGYPSPRDGRGLGYGAGSGLAFGIFFLFIRNAGTSGILWPLCMARVAGTAIILGAAVWLGTRPAGPGAGHGVLLARITLGERVRAVQRIGLVLAAAGVAMVTF